MRPFISIRLVCACFAALTIGTACGSEGRGYTPAAAPASPTPTASASHSASPSPTASPTPTAAPTPTPVPIGTPAALGSNAADETAAASLSITTTQSAPAGSAVVLIAADAFGSGSTPTSASCSDSAGNTYSTDVTEGTAAALTTICSAHAIASTLASGATITVTWSGGSAGQNVRAQAWFVTGIATSPLDQTASAGATNDAPSSGTTAMTAQPNELLFGAILDEGDTVASSGFSPGTNGTASDCTATGTPTYTSLGGISTANDDALFGIYCVVSSTGSYAATATLTSVSPTWEAALATYRGVTP